MDKGYGLVLNGGGAKGSYHIGCWAALRQLGLEPEITAVSGTSVGALNALLIGQEDFDTAIRLWQGLKQEELTPVDLSSNVDQITQIADLAKATMEKINTLDVDPNGFAEKLASLLPIDKEILMKRMTEVYKIFFTTKGICDNGGLRKIIEDNTNMEKLRSCRKIFFCASKMSESQLFTPYYFCANTQANKEAVVQRALASSAIFPIYSNSIINGCTFIDGGFADNVPVKPLYNLGYRKFIVLYLSQRKLLDKSLYPDCSFIEVIPDETMKDDMYTVINFDRKTLDGYLQKGYHDTMVEFVSKGYKRV